MSLLEYPFISHAWMLLARSTVTYYHSSPPVRAGLSDAIVQEITIEKQGEKRRVVHVCTSACRG